MPEHAPLQPVKMEVASGVAVRVTVVAAVNEAVQVVPQSMPAGIEVTVPEPEPARTTVSEMGAGEKVATTSVAADSMTVQVPEPMHAPPQPEKTEPVPATAVSVTRVPVEKVLMQSPVQSTPAGDEVTRPLPTPEKRTESGSETVVNVAVTLTTSCTVTVHAPMPEHAPLQPANAEPEAAIGQSVTTVRVSYIALQVAPQLMPDGVEMTVPEPLPAFVTFNVLGAFTKVAVTFFASFATTVQVVLVPEHAPLQPVKVEPASTVAVSVTEVSVSNVAEQVAPQSMAAGAETTRPLPAPAFVTVTRFSLKVAVMTVGPGASMYTWHSSEGPSGPVRHSSESHPAKREPGAGVAVSM